jgi:hypothetical protein
MIACLLTVTTLICLGAGLNAGCASPNGYLQPTTQEVALLSSKSVHNAVLECVNGGAGSHI